MNLAAIDIVATALEALASGAPIRPAIGFYMPDWIATVDDLDIIPAGNQPSGYGRGTVAAENLPPECDTVACLGGWTVYLLATDGPTVVANAIAEDGPDDPVESDCLRALASELLGLSREAASELFVPWIYLHTTAEGVAINRATPAQGARVLRLVAAGAPPLDAWRAVLKAPTAPPPA